jgi:cyclophilin family peptidyl-prolyl cis-trans isomerase/HEAT repeat protein/thiol-disulfide isomerase/thioredoxin
MRKALLLPFALALACGSVTLGRRPSPTAPPPTAPAAAAAPAVTEPGLSVDDEARILALEDRREFDASLAASWLANPNPLYRSRMALSLGRIGAHTFVDANGNRERDPGERQAGVGLLSALVNDPDRNVRQTTAFALGQTGDATAADALVQLAADASDVAVAAEAVEALSRFGSKIAFGRYEPFTAPSQREGVRLRAIRFLYRFDSDDASAIASENLESPTPAVREAAAYALSRRAYPAARPRLELTLGDADPLTRAYAASALGRTAAADALPALLTALRDSHPWVRTNAVVAIARVAAKNPSAIARPQLSGDVLRIVDVSDDPDPGTRAASFDALGYYATRSDVARKRLLDLSTSGSRWERELAAGVITRQLGDTTPELVDGLLASASGWAKVRIAEASANLAATGPSLRKRLAADSDVLVRENAVGSIPDANVDAEMDLIRPALDDTDVIVRTNAIDRYAHSKSPDVQILRGAESRARTDATNDARLAAIIALAGIDYPEREAFLRSLISDRDPVVRRVAADLIEQKLKRNRPQYTPLPIDRPFADYLRVAAWARERHSATIHMTRGNIEVALMTGDAPMTAWNFAELARKRYLDNTTFMRVVPNFVIQGGDPRNDMNGGPGYSIRDEINLEKYTRGTVGMALSGPDTGGSQFFITHSPQPHLDGNYTIFGRVYGGMSGVADQTERGDRVETIAIDEHAPAAAAAIQSIQSTPLPTEIGSMTVERLLQLPEYAQRRTDYAPDSSELEFMASSIQADDRIEVYLGTWCSDSQREVPRLLKIVSDLKEKHGKNLPVTFVAIDRSKARPAGLIVGKSIEKVATFIYYRNGQEIGRIAEKPQGLLEDDLLAIVARK